MPAVLSASCAAGCCGTAAGLAAAGGAGGGRAAHAAGAGPAVSGRRARARCALGPCRLCSAMQRSPCASSAEAHCCAPAGVEHALQPHPLMRPCSGRRLMRRAAQGLARPPRRTFWPWWLGSCWRRRRWHPGRGRPRPPPLRLPARLLLKRRPRLPRALLTAAHPQSPGLRR